MAGPGRLWVASRAQRKAAPRARPPLVGAPRALRRAWVAKVRRTRPVARALALDPALLLFDELSAGLDPITARGLDELVLSLKAHFGIAIIVVTHELSSIQMIADQAVMLHDGKVLAAGTLEEVQATNHPQIRAFFDRRPRQAVLQRGLLDTILIEGGRYGENPA